MDNADTKKDEQEEEDIYSEIGDGYESDWELSFKKIMINIYNNLYMYFP